MKPERLVVCASHSPGKERDVEHAFGLRFRSALTSAADRAKQFDPDVVIVFGGDHRRAFRHVVPAFGVALSASILAEGGHPAGGLTSRPGWRAVCVNICCRPDSTSPHVVTSRWIMRSPNPFGISSATWQSSRSSRFR